MSHRLRALLAPRSVALIGASERSNWSHRIDNALNEIGYEGKRYLVNPRGGEAHGRPLHTSVGELPEVPDLAFFMVPGSAVLPAMREVAAAGVKAAVVLSSGFAELGEEGRSEQAELARICRAHDMVVLGPNALGYVNTAARVALKPFQPGEELRPGRIAVVSQSGNVTVQIMNMARSFDVGLSFAVSTGNEMDVSVGDVVDYLADDEGTSAIAVFAESFKDPRAFIEACRRARDNGKLVVCLKVGRSEAAARAALAHTGSLVGNDQVVDAFLRDAGVVRVSSLEDLLTVADTYAHTGPIDGGAAVLTISGGTCDIVADRAEEVGLTMPDFAPETEAALKGVLPDFATVHNPLDITGAAVTDASLFAATLRMVAADPGIGVALAVQEIDHQAENLQWGLDCITSLAEVARTAPIPVALANTSVRHLSPKVRQIRREIDAPAIFGGVDRILPAMRSIREWSSRRQVDAVTRRAITPRLPDAARVGTWTEQTCRPLLESAGVAVAPGSVVGSAAEAAAAASAWNEPTVIKVISDDIVHKTDIGGVALGVAAADVQREAQAMLDRVAAAVPKARIDGLFVGPQRPEGIDLLVGVVREPGWGNVLALGLGGIWAEVLHDVQRVALPAGEREIADALRRLRAWPLLAGARGSAPVDLAAVADAIARLGEVSLALGDELAAFEVNPLRVGPAGAEALDAAVVWANS